MSRRSHHHHHHCRKSKSGSSESKEKSSKHRKRSEKRSSRPKNGDSSAEGTKEGIRMIIKLGKNPECRILTANDIKTAKTETKITVADKQANKIDSINKNFESKIISAEVDIKTNKIQKENLVADQQIKEMKDNRSSKMGKEAFRDIGNGQGAGGVNRSKKARSQSLFKNPNDYPYILYELERVKKLQKKKGDRSSSMPRDKPLRKRSLMDDFRKKKSESKDQKHSKDRSHSKHRSASKSKASIAHQSRSSERKRKRSYESDDDTSPISSKKLKRDHYGSVPANDNRYVNEKHITSMLNKFVGQENGQKNVRRTLKFDSDFLINSPQFVIMNDDENMNSAQLVFA